MEAKTSFLAFFALFLVFSSSAQGALDITKELSQNPELNNFNELLTKTKLVDQINKLKAVTVLAFGNASAASIAEKPLDVVKKIVSNHIVLEYYDIQRLTERVMESKRIQMATLFQSSGVAANNAGFVDAALVDEGETVFGSGVKGAPLNAKLVNETVTKPYTISVFQISEPIIAPGIDASSPQTSNAKGHASEASFDAKAPAPASSDANSPAPSPSDANSPAPSPSDDNSPAPAPSDANAPGPASSDAMAPAPASSDAMAPAPAASDANAPAPSPSDATSPAPSPSNAMSPAPSSSDANAPAPASSDAKAPSPSEADAPSTSETPAASPDSKSSSSSDTPPASLDVTDTEANDPAPDSELETEEEGEPAEATALESSATSHAQLFGLGVATVLISSFMVL